MLDILGLGLGFGNHSVSKLKRQSNEEDTKNKPQTNSYKELIDPCQVDTNDDDELPSFLLEPSSSKITNRRRIETKLLKNGEDNKKSSNNVKERELVTVNNMIRSEQGLPLFLTDPIHGNNQKRNTDKTLNGDTAELKIANNHFHDENNKYSPVINIQQTNQSHLYLSSETTNQTPKEMHTLDISERLKEVPRKLNILDIIKSNSNLATCKNKSNINTEHMIKNVTKSESNFNTENINQKDTKSESNDSLSSVAVLSSDSENEANAVLLETTIESSKKSMKNFDNDITQQQPISYNKLETIINALEELQCKFNTEYQTKLEKLEMEIKERENNLRENETKYNLKMSILSNDQKNFEAKVESHLSEIKIRQETFNQLEYQFKTSKLAFEDDVQKFSSDIRKV